MANLSNINNILRTGSLGVGINRDPLGAFEISSATKPGIKMFNTAASGKTYEAYSDANGNYIIYDQDADNNRFVINTSGNATFAGSVNITGGTTNGLNITTSGTQDTIKIDRAATNDNAMTKYQTASADKWIVGLRNTGDDNFRFYSYGISTDALTIDQANGNSTFAGNQVTVDPASGDAILQLQSSTQTLRIDQNSIRTGTNNNLALFTNGNSNQLVLKQSNGFVGIGTITPEAKLDISNVAGGTYALEISTPERNRALFFYNSASVSDAGYLGIKRGSVDALNHRFATSGNSAVCIGVGNFGIGTDSPDYDFEVYGTDAQMFAHYPSNSRGGIMALSSQRVAFTTTGISDDLVFGYNSSTSVSSANFVERMRIDNGTGNVGIGRTSDTAKKLDVLGAGLRLMDTSSYSSITIGASGWQAGYPYQRLDTFNSDGTGYYWALGHRKTDGTKTIRMLVSDTSTRYVSVIDALYVQSFTSNELGGSGNYPTFSTNVVLTNNGISYFNGGNVSVGDTTAQRKFNVIDPTDAWIRISASNYASDWLIGTAGSSASFKIYSQSAAALRFNIDGIGRMGFNYGIEADTRHMFYSNNNTGAATGVAKNVQVRSTQYAGTHIAFSGSAGSSGTISYSGTTTNYNATSDYRLKEDLKDFEGLDKVSKIPVYDFKWKVDENRSYGVLAHELQEVLPQAVTGEKDAEEMQMVDYSKIVPLLVKSIQELKANNDSLKARIETLENN
jgi:hypothetical protein